MCDLVDEIDFSSQLGTDLFLRLVRATWQVILDIHASAVNYVAAAVIAVVLAGMRLPADLSDQWIPMVLGGVNGVLYFLHLMVILAAFRLTGVGITIAFTGMGAVVPVLVAWCFWWEPMSPLRWAAAGLLPAAVFLMRPPGNQHRHLTLKADVLLAISLLGAGLIGTIHKSVTVYAPGGGVAVYQAALFTTAAVTSVGYVWLRRLHYDRGTILAGSVLGACNLLATLFILLSLSVIPAVVHYPTSGSLIIACSVIVSWVLWSERVTKRQIAGLTLAVSVVVLANL